MKIGLLTAFNGSDTTYSLVNVVTVQLRMLIEAGYRPIVFVGLLFKGDGIWKDKRIALRYVTPQTLPDQCKDIDVMLCHDIVFLGQHEEWGAVVRQLAQERPHIAWIHWQHSRGDPQVAPCENSWYAYPNQGDLDHVAWLNQAPRERVRYVPHALDFDYLQWPPLAIRIAQDFDFYRVDVAVFLPTRLDRQKQIDKAVRLVAGLKRAGRSVCLLVGDAMATGDRFLEYKREVNALARELGLTDKEFAFLGEHYEECHLGVPRAVVKALLEMSNLFIQPSNAETCSLVALEASLAGNLLIINADFPPLHALYADAIKLPFGSILTDTKYYRHFIDENGNETKIEDAQQYWDDQAVILTAILDTQLAQKVKRQQLVDRWPRDVFDRYLEPLMLEAWRTVRTNDKEQQHGDSDVTAIITTLDNLPILRRQIPILSKQCGRVIVVNNGSEDDTCEWLKQHYKTYPNLHVIQRNNEGAGKGRNTGIAFWGGFIQSPYTLMIDGGILPPLNGVAVLKDYLERHPDVGIVSPEVLGDGEKRRGCYVEDEADALDIWPRIEDQWTFPQCTLSGTAFALVRANVWERSRFSEDGPFGQPGWGCDDNEMQFKWNALGVIHHDIVAESGVRLYRRGAGSFMRLFRETGIWPNQYGSVYEQRNVKMFQDWRQYYDPIWGKFGDIEYSFVLKDLRFPELVYRIKQIHEDFKDHSHEIIVYEDGLDAVSLQWLDTYALRWHWGDTAILPSGQIVHRDIGNEQIWSGDVLRGHRPPRGKTIILEKPSRHTVLLRELLENQMIQIEAA